MGSQVYCPVKIGDYWRTVHRILAVVLVAGGCLALLAAGLAFVLSRAYARRTADGPPNPKSTAAGSWDGLEEDGRRPGPSHK